MTERVLQKSCRTKDRGNGNDQFPDPENNVDAVYLVSGGKKRRMKIYKTVKGFDYYAD